MPCKQQLHIQIARSTAAQLLAPHAACAPCARRRGRTGGCGGGQAAEKWAEAAKVAAASVEAATKAMEPAYARKWAVRS